MLQSESNCAEKSAGGAEGAVGEFEPQAFRVNAQSGNSTSKNVSRRLIAAGLVRQDTLATPLTRGSPSDRN